MARRGTSPGHLLVGLQLADPTVLRHPGAGHQFCLQAVPALGARRGDAVQRGLVHRRRTGDQGSERRLLDRADRCRLLPAHPGGVDAVVAGGDQEDAAGDDPAARGAEGRATDHPDVTGLLIVSADDLGLTDGVCRAVLRGHLDGVVTSTSLLAVGRSFGVAVRMLLDHPTLDVGAHLAIVGEDPPLLTAREIPTLVDGRGAFPLDYRKVVLRGATCLLY